MNKALLILFILSINACSYKSYSPQAAFAFPATSQNTIKARKLLHEFSIENNLTFTDSSSIYPTGKKIVIAVTERSDGLKIILSGASEIDHITIAIHCHEECSQWKSIYSMITILFSQHWKLKDV